MANVVINEVVANGAIYANGYYGTGLANAVAFRAQLFVENQAQANANFVDVYNLTLAGYTTAPASLFFYNYNSADRIEIYQGSTLVANIDSAVALNSTERAALVGNAYGYFFNDSTDVYMRDFAITNIGGKDYATYAGKITWTHNPSGGRGYTIRTSTAAGGKWRWVCQYPVDGFTIGCPPVPPTKPGDPPAIINTTHLAPVRPTIAVIWDNQPRVGTGAISLGA